MKASRILTKSHTNYFTRNVKTPSKTLANIGNAIPLNKSLIRQLSIKNLRFHEKNSISGGTLENNPISDFYKLKAAGIDSVVSFHNEASSKYAEKCAKAGLKYYNFPMEHSYESFSKKTNEPLVVSDIFVNNLNDFMQIFNHGNVFMGCNFGIDRTNLALTFNYLLNPKAETPPQIISWDEFKPKNLLNRTIKFTKKRIKKFNETQKQIMKLPKNLHDFIYPKIRKLVHFNNYQ